MTKKSLLVMMILLVVAITVFAADVTGKWTYETAGRGGGPGRSVTITLKADGNTLTGEVPGMGRRGGDTPPAPMQITNGKIDGDKVSFDVSRAGRDGGEPMVTKYEGTVSGDEMKLKITSPSFNGGDPRVSEVTAKREK